MPKKVGQSFSDRFKQVKDATENVEAISEGEIEEDTGRWMAIAKASADFAVASGGAGVNPLSLIGPAQALVRALLDVQEAQERLLRSIDENVQLLVDEPFTTGRTYLRRAQETVDDPKRSRTYLERAQTKFYEAQSIAKKHPLDQASVEMHLAICYFLLGYPGDARDMIGAAYEKTGARVVECAEQTGNTKMGLRWALVVFPYTWPSLAASIAEKKERNRLAQENLQKLLPFLNCLAALDKAAGADANVHPAVELIEVKPDKFELVETAL